MIRVHDIYLASFLREETDDEDNPISIYDKPISLECSLNSLNGDYDIAMYGDRVTKMCKTVLDYEEWIDKIKEKDVVYLYGTTPDNEKVNGMDANYHVKSVLPQNLKILVYFEKRI